MICPEKMHQRPGVPGSFPGVFQEFSRSFPGVFQDLQLSEIAPNLQFPELANNCARPAAALRDLLAYLYGEFRRVAMDSASLPGV